MLFTPSQRVNAIIYRWPLCVAEIDPERLCAMKDIVGIVQDLPADMPEPLRKETLGKTGGRRYTNFGIWEDPETRDIMLSMSEQPRTSWEDFTSDVYRYAIRLPNS